MFAKRFAPILPYLAVWAGLFLLSSAWGALLGFHLALLIALLVFRADVPIYVLFKSRNPAWVLAGVVCCGLSGIGLYFLWGFFGIRADLPAQTQALGLNKTSWPPFIAYFSLVNPLIEEYFWRVFLGDVTKKLSAGDFLYAGYHAFILWGKVPFASILFALACLTAAGWFWRQISRADEGLLAAVLGHAAADLTLTVCIYLRASFAGI